VDITLSMDLQDAKDAFIRARDGLASQLSIGYSTDKASIRRDGVRVLESVTLYEISTVALGAAGERAALTSIKAAHASGALMLDTLEQINLQLKLGRVFSAGNETILRSVHDSLSGIASNFDAQRARLIALLSQLDAAS
jgi:hypothetical protein